MLIDLLFFFVTFIDITPDSQIKSGSSFKIACTLTTNRAVIKGKEEVFNSSSLRFEFNSKQFSDDHIIRPNETTAVIDLPSASIGDSGYYYCYVGTSGGNLSFVCSMHLEVGRKCFNSQQLLYFILAAFRLFPLHLHLSRPHLNM